MDRKIAVLKALWSFEQGIRLDIVKRARERWNAMLDLLSTRQGRVNQGYWEFEPEWSRKLLELRKLIP